MLKILDQRPAEAGSWDVTFETDTGERMTLHLKDGEPKDVAGRYRQVDDQAAWAARRAGHPDCDG